MEFGKSRAAIERRALASIRAERARSGPYRIEIAAAEAAWYIVETVPGAEYKAARFLADRGVGVFVPEFFGDARRLRFLGKVLTIDGRRLIFPRHLFVYLWGVEANMRRVLECPSVRRMVTVDDVPVTVPWKQIDELQALQFGPMAQRGKKRTRRQRAGDPDGGPMMITITTRSF